ncbi:response regulator transcription factor [Nonomuraea sp. NPDC004297]
MAEAEHSSGFRINEVEQIPIAAVLVISPLTVKTRITRAITKLGVRDRVQLVILAYEHGLVSPSPTDP